MQLRGDGPFRMLAKINDNAYKIDLPMDYRFSPTFNVFDLSSYFAPSDSRMTQFSRGGG